jgi:hypothetical protein
MKKGRAGAALSPEFLIFRLKKVVPRGGVEPPTHGFSVLLNTGKLRRNTHESH